MYHQMFIRFLKSVTMKTASVTIAVTLVSLLSSFFSICNAASIPATSGGLVLGDDKNYLLPIEPSSTKNGKEGVLDSDDGHRQYTFSHEDIEKNRIVTIDIDGKETVSTDSEVMETLKLAHNNNSAYLFDEPHFQQGLTKRSIIGVDERYHRHHINPPYTAIGFLSTHCTAYAVGPRHLLTAAHCLFRHGYQNNMVPLSHLRFYLRRNCYSYGFTYTVSQVSWYLQYNINGDPEYDIAFLLLSSSMYNWMGFAYSDSMSFVSGEICGYPSDIVPYYQCFYCSRCNDVAREYGSAWWNPTSDNRLQYTCDTKGGMSSSPVMTYDHDSTSTLYSYGVHTHGVRGFEENAGVRISRKYFYDICQWKCNTGAKCSALC